MVKMGQLFGLSRMDSQTIDFERLDVTDKVKSNLLSHNEDLLFSRTSVVAEGVGKCSIVFVGDDELIFDSNLIRVRLDKDKVDPSFCFYYFNSSLGRAKVLSLASGAAVTTVTGTGLSNLEIPYPPLDTQYKIVAVLSAYDDLIENNTRRIQILEEMAQAIYRQWFVEFQFPGHEAVPLVDSETELGEIPQGWEVGIIRDICDSYRYGYTASAQTEPVGPKFLRITDIAPYLIDWDNVPHCEIEEKNIEKYILREGYILVARTGATTSYAKRLGKRIPKSIFASYLVRFRIKTNHSHYLYGLVVESDDYKQFIKANLGGVAQPSANAQALTSYPIVIPPQELQELFAEKVQSLFDSQEILLQKNANLRAPRDLLLPRLVSGAKVDHRV